MTTDTLLALAAREGARCATCAYFEAPGPTAQEKFEADPLPVPRGLFGWLRWSWNPSKFKLPPDDFDSIFDGVGSCRRWPTRSSKLPTHWCGEWLRARTTKGSSDVLR